jgi:hypothetical protein
VCKLVEVNVAFELEVIGNSNESIKKKKIDFKGLNESLSGLTNEEFLIIENCPSMSSAFETFIALIASYFMRIPTALGVFIKVHAEIDFLSDRQLLRILEGIKNFSRSFLFAYETLDDHTGVINWRLADSENIYQLAIGENDEDIGYFVARCLMRSLKNSHSGKEKKNWH